MIAELLCAWFAGLVLGWRIAQAGRRTEVHHWIMANEQPFDWAEEPE